MKKQLIKNIVKIDPSVVATRVASFMVSAHVTLFLLQRIVGTKYYKGPLKRKLNLALQALKFADIEQIGMLYKHEEDATEQTIDIAFDFIEEVAKLPLYAQGEVTAIIQAYNMDRESFNELAKKTFEDEENKA